jgi:spore maturation protein CgeB
VKVLLIGRVYVESFADFIADELRRSGHDVVVHDPGPKLLAFGSAARFYFNRVASKAGDAIKSAKRALGLGGEIAALRKTIEQAGAIDLVLSTHDYLTPDDAAAVKALTRAPLALWYPDPIWSFQKHMFLNAPFDALFFKDPFIVDLLKRKLGAPVYYLPECYSPAFMDAGAPDETADPRYAADICTAGNLYAYRIAFFRNLADKNVRIWGLPPPLWMRLGAIEPMVERRFVAHGEKAKAFRSAKIVLNNLNPSEIWGTNVRAFEICGAGAFQLTDWRPGLSQLFDLGKEIATFDDVADLRAKVEHYLAAEDERKAIAAAGHRRAAREHTYANRLNLLIDTVAGRERGFAMPQISWGDAVAR